MTHNSGSSRWVDDPQGYKMSGKVKASQSLFILYLKIVALWPLSTALAKFKKLIIFYVILSFIVYMVTIIAKKIINMHYQTVHLIDSLYFKL